MVAASSSIYKTTKHPGVSSQQLWHCFHFAVCGQQRRLCVRPGCPWGCPARGTYIMLLAQHTDRHKMSGFTQHHTVHIVSGYDCCCT